MGRHQEPFRKLEVRQSSDSQDSQVVVEKVKHCAASHYFFEGQAFLSVRLVFIIFSKTEEKGIKKEAG